MFSFIDILLIFLYLVGCLFIGLYKATKIKTLEEYSLGKSQYPSTIMTATIFATSISSYSTIGTIEKIYTLGFFFILTFIAKPVFFLISGHMLSRNIEQFKGCMSISDMFEVLYGKSPKILVTLVSLLMCIGMVTIQIYAISIILHAIGIDSFKGTIISFMVLICYSSLGGVRAVSFTDLFQFLVFFIALPVICSSAFWGVGGFSGIYNHLGSEYFNLNLSTKDIILFVSIFAFNSIPALAPPVMQRMLMVKSSVRVSKIFYTNALLCIPFFLIIAIIGMTVKISCANSDNLEKDIIRFLVDGVPNGVAGLVISGLLAIIMSTADSYLNTASIIFTKDILKGLLKKEESLLQVKIVSFVLGILSIPIALKGINIVDFFWALSSLWSPIIFIPMLVGCYKSLPTREGLFWCSSLFGVLFSCLGALFYGALGTLSTVLGVAGSMFGVVLYMAFSPDNS
jgi:Na+/proline symporter